MKIFKKAILVIHGFAGGTYDQEYLVHRLQLVSNYDIFTFTLPGHDGDFSEKITSNDWIKKVESEIEFLIKNGYRKIYLVGHSMGGVLASHLATKYDEVKKLVLIAPAFRVFGFEGESINLSEILNKSPKILEQYGAQLVANRMLKMPVNCYIEFIKTIKKFQNAPSNIKIPTLIIRGTNDQIVPNESIVHVYDNVNTKYKKIVMLEDITHDVFRENKREQTSKLILKFFKSKYMLKYFDDYISSNDKL